MEFMHIGVPTKTPQPGEVYLDGMKVHITNPDDHEYKYEYLRFEAGSCMPAEVQLFTHVAFKVDSLEAELAKCQEVLVEPVQASDTMRIAFAKRDGVLFEFMQML